MRGNSYWLLGCLCMIGVGCAADRTETSQPSDLSAAEHEAAALAEEEEAREHIAMAMAMEPEPARMCGIDGGVPYAPCWSRMANSADYNLWAAKQHEKRAREHVAAAVLLRDTEQRACQNVSIEDKEISPFYHRIDILKSDPVYEGDTPLGADVFFRKVPGMSREGLQKIIDCQMARNAVLGYDEAWMPSCPLMVPHITAVVSEGKDGLIVSLRAKEKAAAQELIDRASALTKDN